MSRQSFLPTRLLDTPNDGVRRLFASRRWTQRLSLRYMRVRFVRVQVRSLQRFGLGLVALWCIATTQSVRAVDFLKDVEPILNEHCFGCHGDSEQSSQLRLDRLANMLSGGNSGEPAVVPGSPGASYLVKLIKHSEPGWEMPPDDALNATEIATIEEWIRSGAQTPPSYGPASLAIELDHWSFRPVQRPTYAHSIDEFIQLRLRENQLEPAGLADRGTRIRRLFLVMLGFPPTPQRVQEYVSDSSENAWESLVEEVLGSPHFGERFASQWLDLVRFGETHGFETNRERTTAWPYRDWVIDAFNNDLPYDSFVRQQIAGDAFDAPIGTGFLVAGPVDIVKGQDTKLRQMQRMNELDDMINTTGTAFLGLTTGCARCHNHKFDPISQKDYYAMQAVFAGVEHADGLLPLSEKQQLEIAAIEAEKKTLQSQLAKFLPENATMAIGEDVASKAPETLREPVSARFNVERFPKQVAKWVRFTVLATNGGEPCIDEMQVFAGDKNVSLATTGSRLSSSGDFVHPLHKLEHINDGEFGNERSWISSQRVGGWVQIELAQPMEIDRIEWSRDRNGQYGDRLATEYRIEIASDKPEAEATAEVQYSDDVPTEFTLIASSADRQAISASDSPRDRYVFDGFSESEVREARRWLSELDALEIRKNAIENASKAWVGTFRQPGPTHRLYRGEPEMPREQVGPDGVAAFATLNLLPDAPEMDRRVALAGWITDPTNPLTARVIVNRIWQFHFGTGIVDTPSDFGKNGGSPTHPQLLDYLASELIDSGWSLKHIHRLILMSQTWQQSSEPDHQALRIDAGSRLLWRFPPRRLEAESIRDSILKVSGSLDLSNIGGPGFSGFEVQAENVHHYHAKTSYGPGDWRRMIYMNKVRQEREHVFGAFDCPDSSMVVPQRNRSTTPLQALNLLNSNFVMQQAEILAQRLQREVGLSASVLDADGLNPDGAGHVAAIQTLVVCAWQHCFQRDPDALELESSTAFILDEGVVAFARALLNTNEFVFLP